MRLVVRVGPSDFDPAGELAALEQLGGGAVASFTGLVRDDGGIVALHLEHYPAMTERRIAEIIAEAEQRWPLLGVTVLHRVGRLAVGERIVLVGVASAHRMAALEACAFLIDWLKVSAPFWKQEEWPDGTLAWVEAKGADDVRAARWSTLD